MTTLDHSILRTILYADVFDFPLTLSEIQYYLIAREPASVEHIERALIQSPRLRRDIACIDDYFMCAGREHLAAVRHAREAASTRLREQAERYGRWLARLPFVRMVGLTGALAVNNAVDDDDIDYVLVTREGRVWMARAFAILVVRAARLDGVKLCPNYVLAQDALRQNTQDLYIAHEIAQLVPMQGLALYTQMRQVNAWVAHHLPNAGARQTAQGEDDSAMWQQFKQLMEWVLAGRLGDRLERWERERKLRRFAPALEQAAAARLDAQHVKGHFRDHGHPALARYRERLDAYGIAGDV